ncbi:MAG: peptidase M14, partial [Bacteroidota bacterium]
RKEDLLYNMYKMGRDAIESTILDEFYAYVIPTEQWDKREAVNLVNILRQGGVEVHQAESDFFVGEKLYKSGSFIAYAGQAFRPFLEDLMEEQDYPDKRAYPGGPPIPPYDLAGWTLPYQMGVSVDRIEEKFKVQSRQIDGRAALPKGSLSKGRRGYRIRGKSNAAFQAVNKILASGGSVSRVVENSGEFQAGDFICQDKNTDTRGLAESLGIDFIGFSGKIKLNTKELRKPKIALYKSWVANMDEGWTRWWLTDYHFDWDTLHDADIQTRDLSEFDAIIIPHQSPERILNGHKEGFMPEAYTGGIGLDGTLKLKEFVAQGGSLITFDAASDFAIDQLGLPVSNPVRNISPNTFFIPGSLIRTNINTKHHLAWGMQKEVAASYSRSRAFNILVKPYKREGGNETKLAKAPRPKVEVVARYAKEDLLMSGWANGEKRYIGNKAAVLEAEYGQGKVILFGFRPQFRGQPRATYKLVFNAIYASVMD